MGKDFETIKKSISIPPRYFRNEINSWVNYNLANCYQYALSIYVDEEGSFIPGAFSRLSKGYDKKKNGMYTDEELVCNVQKDIDALGLEMRLSTLEEVIDDENSWKIAIMNVRVISMEDDDRYDFHFLRQSRAGEWSQKFRGKQHPDTTDERYKTITDPAKASYDFPYELVGYYVITKKIERGEP